MVGGAFDGRLDRGEQALAATDVPAGCHGGVCGRGETYGAHVGRQRLRGGPRGQQSLCAGGRTWMKGGLSGARGCPVWLGP